LTVGSGKSMEKRIYLGPILQGKNILFVE